MMLSRIGERGYHCFVPHLREKSLIFYHWIWCKLPIGILYIFFINIRKFLSSPNLLRVCILNDGWILPVLCLYILTGSYIYIFLLLPVVFVDYIDFLKKNIEQALHIWNKSQLFRHSYYYTSLYFIC